MADQANGNGAQATSALAVAFDAHKRAFADLLAQVRTDERKRTPAPQAPTLTGVSLADVDAALEALGVVIPLLDGQDGYEGEALGLMAASAILGRVHEYLTPKGTAHPPTQEAPKTPFPPKRAASEASTAGAATPTASTASRTSAPVSHSPTDGPARVEPTDGLHTTDAENDKRLAKFHEIRSNYLTPEGKPRVASRVAYLDAVYNAVVQGAQVPAYVAPEGVAPWEKATAVAERIAKLFD